MMNQSQSLRDGEEAVFLLRSLYEKFGYSQFKMSKFEEYDLYVRNKDFLISDGIITFTDTNGKLLALKPDVTLSIVKNYKFETGVVSKVFYDENVYRVSSGTQSFKEIMQVGIECMGHLDPYQIFEVLSLAARSLRLLAKDCVLDLSHFGMLSGLIESFGVTAEEKRVILNLLGEKNTHELSCFCDEIKLLPEQRDLLLNLASLYGSPKTVLPQLEQLLCGKVPAEDLSLLRVVCDRLEASGFGDMVRIDFSVVNHTDYYNGIVFKGFVKGIPTGILSGGQYDRLMQKMGKNAGAIGFAVYLDLLENAASSPKEFDVDILLLYGADADLSQIDSVVNAFAVEGKSVMVQKKKPEKLRCREVYEMRESGVKLLERYA